ADYSQIEMRVMAHLSGDEGLIEAFRTGEDLHSFVGSRAFGVPIDAVASDLRRRVQALRYGLAGGLGAFGLASPVGLPQSEPRAQTAAHFARWGGVRGYLETVAGRARDARYAVTLLGRRRSLPELHPDIRLKRELAERAAVNA